MAIFEELSVNGQKYLLAHTVSEKDRIQDFNACTVKDFLFGEPEYDKQYFDDTVIITGHTPTDLIQEDSLGKIWKGNNHIAIDCGAVFGNSLGCLCLNTLEEFYV